MTAAMVYEGPIASDGGTYFREKYRKFNKPMPCAFSMLSEPGIIATASVRSGFGVAARRR